MSVWEKSDISVVTEPKHTCRGKGDSLPKEMRLRYWKNIIVVFVPEDADLIDKMMAERREMKLYLCHGCHQPFGIWA